MTVNATTMSDVFLAILSLDSYNRGYGKGMEVDGTSVGSANVIPRATTIDQKNAGFYAQEYEWNGTTVISYRGTTFTGLPNGADVLHGWSLSEGFASASQAQFAKDFYTLVTGQAIYGGSPPEGENLILTGHSLGGGLAGFVASVSGASATIFNNIPFGSGAVADIMTYNYNLGLSDLSKMFGGGPLASGNYVGLPIASSNIQQFITLGEVAALMRGVIGPAGSLEHFTKATGNPVLAGLATAYGIALDLSMPFQTLQSNSGLADPSNLHSQSLMVTLLYADANKHTDWQELGAELFTAEFNTEIAQALGWKGSSESEWFGEAGKMLASIAYSAIDEGERPFGDTGIRAMFNDLDQLGKYYEEHPTGFLAGDGIKQALVDIAVQYAGDLALQDKQDDVEAHKGTLAVFNDENVMVVDFDPAKWVKTTENGNEIVGRTELIEALIAESGGNYELNSSDAEDITVFYATLTDDSVKWSVGNDNTSLPTERAA
jgi:hypothetical protein